MSIHRANHLNRILNWFESKVSKKYIAGQKEHGGNIWEKTGLLSQIKDEVIDLVVYIETLEEQLFEKFPDAYRFVDGEETLPKAHYIRKRPRIYVSGAITAPSAWEMEDNIYVAGLVARRLWEAGASVLCPHTNTAHMDGPGVTPQDFLDGDFEWIAVSDAVYMINDWEESKGACEEKKLAEVLGIPVYTDLNELILRIPAIL